MEELLAPELDSPPLRRYGLPQLVFGTSPAANTDFSQSIDGWYLCRLLSVFCRLVTDGNAANREVVLSFEDSAGSRYCVAGAATVVTASTTVDYSFQALANESAWSIDSSIVVPFSPLILLPTHQWKLHLVNGQAGDQLSRVRFVREQFYNDPELL